MDLFRCYVPYRKEPTAWYTSASDSIHNVRSYVVEGSSTSSAFATAASDNNDANQLDETEDGGAQEEPEIASPAAEQVSEGHRPVLLDPHLLHRLQEQVHFQHVSLHLCHISVRRLLLNRREHFFRGETGR